MLAPCSGVPFEELREIRYDVDSSEARERAIIIAVAPPRYEAASGPEVVHPRGLQQTSNVSKVLIKPR
jgi:hypothetical protein